MKSITRTARRGLAAGLASVLVAGAGAVLAAPAQADAAVAPTPELQWNISHNFVEHLYMGWFSPSMPRPAAFTGELSGGAEFVEVDDPSLATQTRGDDYFTFPAAGTTLKDGTVAYAYDGAVKGIFKAGGTPYYSVKVANPVVVVEADGTGEIQATVSSEVYDNPGQQAGATAPKKVTVAELDSVSVAGGVTTVTPKFEGVLPAGSQTAQDLGLDAGKPVDGAAWHPDFIRNLLPSTNAHFFKSGASADPKKAPGVARVVNGPVVDTQVLKANETDGVQIRVRGINFDAASAPGANGIYLVLVPSGETIDYGNWGSVEGMAAAAWLAAPGTPGALGPIVDGKIDYTLSAPASKIVPGTSYDVVTWAAHERGDNASQDSTTRVAINWSTWAKPAAATTTTLTAKAGTRAATLTAKVSPAAAGKVSFKQGAEVVGSANVVNGTATLKLTGLTGGARTYTAVFTPANAKAFKASTAKAVKVTVAKAASKTTVKVTKKATRKKAGKATVTVTGGGLKATGKATVKIKAPGKKTVTKKVTLRKGKATVALTKAKKKGTYKVVVTYAGDKNLKAAKKVTKTFKVKK